MHFKKSATLLTLVAIPAAVTIVSDAPVSANTSYSYTSDYQVRNVEILIEQLNPYSSTFYNDLYNIQTLYTALSYTQQSQVYNRDILFSYSNSYWNGWNSTEYQTVINTFTTKVSAISVSSRTFIRDVEEASRYYSALNSMQKAAIPQYLYIQLQNYIDGIANMRAVEERLLALNTNDWNYITTYQSVMVAYNALPYDYRALLSSQATAKMKEYELYYSVEHNRATSQTVITAISKLTTSSPVTEVQRVRTLYNNLTVYQKTLVTNIKDLIYIEDVLKTPSLGWDPYYELYNDSDEEKEEVPTEIDVTQRGNTYKITMPVSDMNRYTATTISVTDNVTLKIPRSAIPRSNDSAVVAMTLDEVEGEAIVFTASLYNESLNFSSYIDIEVNGLPRNAVILRLDENGEYVAAPYSRVLNKHVIKTKTSNEFIVSTNNVVFYDIQTDGHRSQIEELAKRKIVTGVEKNYFRPSANVTVAQFAAMISRSMALTATESSSYGDVQGKWYESSIQALLEAGILEEKSSNRFNPEQVVTRKQAAMMAIRMLEHAGVSMSTPNYSKVPFKDLSRMSSNERYYAALAYEYGIFGGKENGKFDPNAKLTRSQMAKVLHRTLQIAKML